MIHRIAAAYTIHRIAAAYTIHRIAAAYTTIVSAMAANRQTLPSWCVEVTRGTFTARVTLTVTVAAYISATKRKVKDQTLKPNPIFQCSTRILLVLSHTSRSQCMLVKVVHLHTFHVSPLHFLSAHISVQLCSFFYTALFDTLYLLVIFFAFFKKLLISPKSHK
jgi:hypothetical protein